VKARRVVLTIFATLALAGPAGGHPGPSDQILNAIDHLRKETRKETNELRRRAGRKPLPASSNAGSTIAYRDWVRAVWKTRLAHARRLAPRKHGLGSPRRL
jgi:hypothetical protein